MMNNTMTVADLVKVIRGNMITVLLTTSLICSACTSQPAATPRAPGGMATPSATSTPPPVATAAPTPTANPFRVVKAMPSTQAMGTEDFHLNNCGGTTPLHQPFSDAGQISTDVVVSDQATLSDGTIIPVPEAMRSELAHQVELAYDDELAAARATLDATEMMAPPYTRWYVVVSWTDSVYVASVSFPSDGITAMAAYTYTLHVPEMGYFKTMPCTA